MNDAPIVITDADVEDLRSEAKAEMSDAEWEATGKNVFTASLVAGGVLPPSTPLD